MSLLKTEILEPSIHHTAWTQAHCTKIGPYLELRTASNDRFLLSAVLDDKNNRVLIFSTEHLSGWDESRDTPHPTAGYCALVEAGLSAAGGALCRVSLTSCEACDSVGRQCEPQLEPPCDVRAPTPSLRAKPASATAPALPSNGAVEFDRAEAGEMHVPVPSTPQKGV